MTRSAWPWTLSNLASLLRGDPHAGRTRRATWPPRRWRSSKPSIPGAAQIWTTYGILGDIAALQDDIAAARRYRADGATGTYAAAPIAREKLCAAACPLIGAVLAAGAAARSGSSSNRRWRRGWTNGWGNLVGALRAVADGQRDERRAMRPLGREEAR